MDDRITKLKNAFAADHFQVDDETGVYTYRGQIGMAAAHQTAFNYDARQPKKACYIEGNPHELGYLMGLMAEPEVARMATEFVDNIVLDMIDPGLPATDAGGQRRLSRHKSSTSRATCSGAASPRTIF